MQVLSYTALLLMLGLFVARTFRHTFAAAGQLVSAVTLVILAATAYLQVSSPDSDYYPFASWTMYSSAPSLTTWRLQARRQSGGRTSLNLADLIRGPSVRSMTRRITHEAARLKLSANSLSERHARGVDLSAVANALSSLDAARSSADPITAIEIDRCEITGRPPWTRRSVRCTTMIILPVVVARAESRDAS